MKSLRVLGLVPFMCLGSYAAADVAETAASCDGCHGDNGVSQWNDMPTIAGIDAFVHSDALYAYQEEARPCATVEIRQGPRTGESESMCEAAKSLGDDDIEAIAEHYAALPFVPAAQEFDADLAAAGKAVHDAECSRCHTDGGSNPEDEASILAGQWMGYLERAFAEYAAGERDQPDKMKEKMDPLTDDQVTALIHYYASQQ